MNNVPKTVAALVLAAGSSRRLGQPKQLLPFGDATLLDATLEIVRSCSFDQRFVTIGAVADEIRQAVDLSGFTVVASERHTEGCSSSLVSALPHFDPTISGFVLLLGDQPGVTPDTVDALVRAAHESDAAIAVCDYDDGIGHPFWFARSVFDDLLNLRGDKAVWKVVESGNHSVQLVRRPGTIPLDVDTLADYLRLLSSPAAPPTTPLLSATATEAIS